MCSSSFACLRSRLVESNPSRSNYPIQIIRLVNLILVRFSLLLELTLPSTSSLSVPDISSSPDSIREALSKALSIVYPEESLSLEQFNSTYPQKHANSAAHILASAKGLREIRGESGNEEAAQLILQCTRPENQPSLEVSRSPASIERQAAICLLLEQ